MKPLLFFILAISGFHYSQATTRKVPQKYSTIQAALNACSANDTIKVTKGTYYENLVWPAIKGIKLISKSGSAKTFIDANHNGTVITFSMGDTTLIDSTTLIDGFTIQHGYYAIASDNGYALGTGVHIFQASPKIANCIITKNRVEGIGEFSETMASGVAIYTSGVSHLILNNVTISRNRIDNIDHINGVVIFTDKGSINLYQCTITEDTAIGNSVIGGIIFSYDPITFTKCKIQNNYCQSYAPGFTVCYAMLFPKFSSLENCLVTDNVVKNGAGSSVLISTASVCSVLNSTVANNQITSGTGNYCLNYTGSGFPDILTITNCIFWHDDSYSQADVSYNVGSNTNITYSDIRSGISGTGNFSKKPKFMNATNFKLKNSSACINAGTNLGAPSTDIDGNARPLPGGTNVDLGCYEMNQPLRLESAQEETVLSLSIAPNPISSAATITINLSQPSNISLKLFSIEGKEVMMIVNENFQEGNQQVTLNRQSLSAGIYFLQLKMNDMVVVVKKVAVE